MSNGKTKYYPTGNEIISVPTIREDGAIEGINFIHMGYRGLIEICGEPFLKPLIEIENIKTEIKIESFSYENYWIPQFKGKAEELEIEGKIYAPINNRGFIYSLNITNKGIQKNITAGIMGSWKETLHSINESKIIDGKKVIYNSNWINGPIFDFKNGITLFSFGFQSDEDLDKIEWKMESNETVQYKFGKDIYLKKDETKTLNFYIGLGLEEVGAAASAIEMRRQTADKLLSELQNWLMDKTKVICKDDCINEIFNINQFFNYFYAAGRTMDTEDLVLVTSRSPRYYVSATYWDRDSLLWSFPSLLITNSSLAEEALDYVFKVQIKNVGVHSRYIDGTVLEPGFELDELCAPIIALNKYIQFTNDFRILEKKHIKLGIERILKRLKLKKHNSVELYETFLMPTDDMHDYPYLTYNNVLVWKVYRILSGFYEKLGNKKEAEKFKENSSKVKDAIYNYCVKTIDNEEIFVWSVDLKGRSSIYDEPPGSLTILPYIGFCSSDNDVYVNTCNYLYSSKFDYYFNETNFEELGCSHAEHPWVLSIANSLINGRKDKALDMLKRTPLDNKIACESIDKYTGECITGAHFATCAGFLCFALYEALKQEISNEMNIGKERKKYE